MKKQNIERKVEQFSAGTFDLIITGGGIYGLMIALEASRRGKRALLLERGDFCEKTSHNHLRTVHGGIRYLQKLDFPRFRDSVGERKWFLKHFPGYVRVMPCMMPLYNKGLYRRCILWPALQANDILSFSRNFSVDEERHLPGGRLLSRSETQAAFPLVDADGLKGAALWYDGALTEFQALYMLILKLAIRHGASALNYTEVTGLIQDKEKGAVQGVKAIDRVSGNEVEFQAPVVVNACGPWSRDIAENFDKDKPQLFKKRLLLWNVLFDRPALSEYALGLDSNKGLGQTYFFHPWKNRLLVGTPERVVEKSDKETDVPAADVEKFIAEINRIVPGADLKASEVLRIYSGILPAETNGRLSGRPALVDHGRNGGPGGLYSIAGVKFTTSRLESERLLQMIYPGSQVASYDEIIPKETVNYFPFDYDWEPREDKDFDILKEIIASEAVVHLSDLILRRSSLGDNPPRARRILPAIRSLFNWDDAQWQAEVELLEQQIGVKR